MMEENNSKKILLSVLGVAILVVAVVGISFAAFTYTKSSDANSIKTGTITMSYSEPTNGIELVDALPMSDEAGKALTGDKNVFAFTVSTGASGAVNVPYEINMTPVSVTEGKEQLSDGQVKVYLTKNGTEVLAPTLVSGLTTSTVSGRSTSKVLYSTTDNHDGTSAEATVTNYVLRMWIDNAVTVDDITNDEKKPYEYRLKVNVDSTVNALGK